MNVYAIGVLISLIVYFVVGNLVSRRVKTANDYYVAGRRAPVILITGSLVASFLGTGVFLGDSGESYMGFFIPIMTVSVLACAGYPIGSAFFGRYVRRSRANTIPEYFAKRFNSTKIQKLAGVIVVVICFIYMLSVIDGLATLMAQILPFSRNACMIIAWVAFTFFTVFAGSEGVLLTDTIMFGVFTAAIIVAVPCIAHKAGGWFNAIETMATADLGIKNYAGFGGNLEWMYPTAIQNFIWSVVYGIVWALVVSVSPWQSSRYLMAKDEHTVIRSGAWACISVLFLNTFVLFGPIMVRILNQNIDPFSTVNVWAAMNAMPKIAGIILITGVVAAGVSSASTFLSLIGFSAVNDIAHITDDKKKLSTSRIVMLIASVLILLVSLFKPSMIWWMTQFSSSVVAASWGVVAFASVWWKRITKKGAFMGMLFGFVAAIVTRMIQFLGHVTLPLLLDPFLCGVYASVIGLLIGTFTSEVSKEENQFRDQLFVIPEVEKNPVEIKKTKNVGWILLAGGVIEILFLLIFYAIPYTRALM